MRKLLLVLLGLLTALGTQAVTLRPESAQKKAHVQLQDASPILGTWTLVEVAPRLTGPRIPENRMWEFKPDGTLITSGYNRHFKTEDHQEFHYEVKDGMIVTEVPGRKDKQLVYRVYDLKDDTLILQGGMEGFYFFKRK